MAPGAEYFLLQDVHDPTLSKEAHEVLTELNLLKNRQNNKLKLKKGKFLLLSLKKEVKETLKSAYEALWICLRFNIKAY